MNELFKKLNLGIITNIEPVDSSQNSVVKITTLDNAYLVKQYSKDAIKNENDLLTRTKQIDISKVLNSSGIPTILPIEFNNENFIHYDNKYYLIYNYLEYKTLSSEELNDYYITTLAETLASLHKLNLHYDLPIQYKTINIDYDAYLTKLNKEDKYKELYKLMLDNKKELTNLINTCNNILPKLNKDLCISHNDYKLKNILWNNEQIYLIDFDASSLSNPAVSLAESAFALSRQKGKVNYDFYKLYLTSYLKTYGTLNTNYSDALTCAMNGKLQWYEYLLNNVDEPNRIDDSISMTKELLSFIDSKEKLLSIYNNITYRI